MLNPTIATQLLSSQLASNSCILSLPSLKAVWSSHKGGELTARHGGNLKQPFQGLSFGKVWI